MNFQNLRTHHQQHIEIYECGFRHENFVLKCFNYVAELVSTYTRKNTSIEGYQHICLMKKKRQIVEALARASVPVVQAYPAIQSNPHCVYTYICANQILRYHAHSLFRLK